MNLQETVSKITGLQVTEGEAMAFARDNFDAIETEIKRPYKGAIEVLKDYLIQATAQFESSDLKREISNVLDI